MVGLSRRHSQPKPIDFLLPWLHRRDIKSRTRIKQKIWCKERSEMEINVRYFPHLTRENGPMKTIMHLMVGLSRRHLRPKPIDFLLPWLHRRDIMSRPRIRLTSRFILCSKWDLASFEIFLFKIKFFYVFGFILIYGSKIIF